MNHITIELCAEDRARLDSILDQLQQLNTVPAVFDGAAKEDKPQPQPEPAQESRPAVTLDDIRALAQELLAPASGKRDKVRALIKGYAKSVTELPQDKWNEVHAALTALKGE